MATHSSILAWEIQRVEEPGGLESMGLQRIRHHLATQQQQQQQVFILSPEKQKLTEVKKIPPSRHSPPTGEPGLGSLLLQGQTPSCSPGDRLCSSPDRITTGKV